MRDDVFVTVFIAALILSAIGLMSLAIYGLVVATFLFLVPGIALILFLIFLIKKMLDS